MVHWRLPAVCALALFAHILGAPEGAAQATEQRGRAPGEDTVVVTAERTEEAIRDFVGQIAVAGRSQDQLTRWDQKICPGILGLRESYAQLALDQIARRASDVGLDVGDPGCNANILVIVSMDPDAAARALFDNYKRKLGYYYQAGRKTLGRNALDAFVESKAPVRWWHVSNTLSEDGRQADTRKAGKAAGLREGLPTVAVSAPSHIKRSSRQDLGRVFVIVDGRRLRGLSLAAVADYIAMASLAQLDPDADTSGYPTILNLFNPPAEGSVAPVSMTEWDVAYLRGLYDATRNSHSNKQQAEIARSMNKDFSTPE